MSASQQSWKLYAGGALILWAVGLQVASKLLYALAEILPHLLWPTTVYAPQVNMWSLKKKPEFKEKFPEVSGSSDQTQVRGSAINCMH